MPISTIENPRAAIISSHRNGGTIVATLTRSTDLAGDTSSDTTALVVALDAGRRAFEGFRDALNGAEANFQSGSPYLADAYAKAADGLKPVVRSLRKAGTAYAVAVAKALSLSIPLDPAKAQLRSEQRYILRERPGSTVAALAATSDDLDTVAAIVEPGQGYWGIDDDQWARVEDNARILGHIARSGIQASFPTKPTLDKPIVVGPDHAAVRRAAEQQLAELKARQEIVNQLNRDITSIIRFVAAATDKPVNDVFAALITNNNAN